MTVKHLDIGIQQLAVGRPLECDVLDASGGLLLSRGTILQQSVVDNWNARGFTRVRVQIYTGLDQPLDLNKPGPPLTDLMSLYDDRAVVQLAQNFSEATTAVNDFVMNLALQGNATLKHIEPIIQTYLSQIEFDNAIVLANLASPHDCQLSSTNAWLGARSVRMGVLGATVAATLKLSKDQCNIAAIAGLLHDVSLFDEEQTEVEEETLGAEAAEIVEAHQYWINHSIRSAEMLDGIQGIPEVVRVIVSQVHEQVDGLGYPRGLTGRHLNIISRILNLVDAFLTLTEPLEDHLALVPSDAMAYLISHTNQGVFDRECMKAILLATSIYPVGSKVELDDRSIGTILRSTYTDPVRPIVSIQGDRPRIIDLREGGRTVVKPITDERFPFRRRLPVAAMKQVLWKPAFISEAVSVGR
ncbi:MAG: HD domain-containing phosphohydrolase [Pirellulales bacterium]